MTEYEISSRDFKTAVKNVLWNLKEERNVIREMKGIKKKNGTSRTEIHIWDENFTTGISTN